MIKNAASLLNFFSSHQNTQLSHTIKISAKVNEDFPVIVFGLGTHGNELCGVRAAHTFLHAMQLFGMALQSGTVYFAIINPKALEKGVRLIDDNMNRVFDENYTNNNSCELERAGYVKEFLENINFDVFIDIHSMFPTDNQMILLSGDECEDALQLATSVSGTRDVLIEGIDNGHLHSYAKKILQRKHKLTNSFLIECGLHDLQSTDNTALELIIKTLQFYKMLEFDSPNLVYEAQELSNLEVYISYCVVKNGMGFKWLIQNPHNKQRISKGQAISQTIDGLFCAPIDGYLIMPGAIENIKSNDIDCGWIVYKK
jgi:hypothetical protein